MQRKKFYILSGSLVLSVFASLAWEFPLRSPESLWTSKPFLGVSVPADTVQKSGRRPKYKIKDRYTNRFSDRSPSSPFIIKDTKSTSTEFKLDSAGRITVYEKLTGSDANYRPSQQMTFEEYQKVQQNRFVRDYWKKYAASQDGKDETRGRGILPKIELPPAIDRIFGGSEIDFKPNGNILLDIGYIGQFIDNPAIPVQQRYIGNLNFNEQAQINFQGKIGNKFNLNTNFDTKASFNFQNQLKLNWRSNEEDILQNIEVGNTSWTLNSQLIPGVQNLFGLKTLMRFGKVDVTLVAAQQRSKQDCITLKGGSQGKTFEIRADNYDENRHFFLSTFFRNKYESSLKNVSVMSSGVSTNSLNNTTSSTDLSQSSRSTTSTETAYISSGITITRLEVYVTNRSQNTETLRNIVGFSDLGEGAPTNPYNPNNGVAAASGANGGTPVNNKNNTLYNKYLDPNSANAEIRKADQTTSLLVADGLDKGTDFDVLRGAKKLTEREYRFSPELGYISLVTPLRNDEVLAVSYEYTMNGQKYKVGELTEDYQNRQDNEVLVLKLLKSSTIRNVLNHPMWNLMMKNVYSLNGSQISKTGFQLRVIYKDDNTGIDNPSLLEGRNVKDIPLVQVLGLDKMNQNGDRQTDGNFDFIEGVTVDSRNGKIIFPVLEPFGGTLRKKFEADESQLVDKYVFDKLYTSTLADAQQIASKNKFFLKGSYQSSLGGDVNLPLGVDGNSVQVTAGGVALTPGVDYIVEPQVGRVKILNSGISNSGREIRICYEKPDLFNNQIRTLLGTHIDYTLGKDIHLGGTLQHLSETPPSFLTRVQIGNEPINNTMFGLDAAIQKKSLLLTRLVDALPLISTKETSAIDFQGEFARLIPGVNSAVNSNAFIDDFESARNIFSLNTQANSWRPGSVPKTIVPITSPNTVESNFNRAKISAYTVDYSLYGTSSLETGSVGINSQDVANYAYERVVSSQALFPNRSVANNINVPVGILDVSYFPGERGMYNYNPKLDQFIANPKKNFGAITRAISSDTDFDNANIETLEFWMMDPFAEVDAGATANSGNRTGIVRATGDFDKDKEASLIRNRTGGKLVFNLGDISEDFIPDGRYNFENGIPTGQKITQGSLANVDSTVWGLAPTRQFVTNAFDLQNGREQQDVGLDGLPNNPTSFDNVWNEKAKFADYVRTIQGLNIDANMKSEIEEDPSGDDFIHYLNERYSSTSSLVKRYKNYMGLENNSPPSSTSTASGYTEASNQQPDREDLNNDNTITDTDAYYEYELDMKKEKMAVGQNYIVDQITEGGVSWYLFRIPIKNYSNKVGNINGFKSMRFIRMFTTDWEAPVVFRFASFQLSGYQYRTYTGDLTPRGLQEVPEPYDANFKVSTVNIDENGPANKAGKTVPYSVPPGFQRDRDVTTVNNVALNEQSMSLCVDGLRDGDSRAVFKNTVFDFLNYKNLKMFIHAETDDANTRTGDVSAFVRIGTDQTDNYYEVETRGLTITPKGKSSYLDTEVWPAENEIDIPFDALRAAKLKRDKAQVALTTPYLMDSVVGNNGQLYRVRVVGRPDLSAVVSLMIGVRNPKSSDELPKSFCIWVDELRSNGFDQTSGNAAVGKLGLKLADFANVTLNASYKGYGFGGVQSKISERSRETSYAYGIAATINLDKLFPDKWGLRIPLYISYDKSNSTPHFNPLDPDIPLEQSLNNITDPAKRAMLQKIVEDNSERRAINLTNVRKIKVGGGKAHLWDIENIAISYSFAELTRSNTLIDAYKQVSHRGGIMYAYAGTSKPIEPFKGIKSDYPLLRWIKEINFSPLPNSITVRADMDRNFVKTQLRNADLTTDGVAPMFEKYWMFTRQYNLGWNLTKSVIVNYAANARAIIDEPQGDIDTQAKKDSVWRSIKSLGRTKNFDQNFSAVWRLPLNKSPLTDWMSAEYSHKFGYQYLASSYDSRDSLDVPLGNLIKNTRERGINGKIDFVALYNRVRALRLANQPRVERKNVARSPGDDEDIIKPQPTFVRSVTRLMMAIRGINVRYTINESTTLPGFMPGSGILGMSAADGSAPGFGFVTGSQDYDVLTRAAANGWLSKSIVQNVPFVQTKTQNFTYGSSIEPFRDFRIQLEGKWSRTDNYQEFYRPTEMGGAYKHQSPVRSGNYQMTFLSFLTAFDSNAPNESSGIFNRFKSYRNIIKQRLEASRVITGNEAYDINSQDVLIPAFFAAYSGISPNKVSFSPFVNIPLPNWQLDYNGLSNVGWFKERFSNISITHRYSSTYSVGNFVSSLEYDNPFELKIDNMLYPLSSKVNEQGYLIPVYVMSTIKFEEKFGPFVGFNATTKNKISLRLEYAQDRSVGLNLSNSQVAELSNKDFTFGMGFTKANMLVPFKVNGRKVRLPNDMKFQMNLTVRDTRTIQRKLDAETVVTNGYVNFQFRPQVSYNVNKRLNVNMYVDKMFNNPWVSTLYYRSTIAAGFQVRFSLSD